MEMVIVVARDTFPYAGITRHPGDTFEASTGDARLLSLIGRVDLAEVLSADPVPTPRARRRRDQTADGE